MRPLNRYDTLAPYAQTNTIDRWQAQKQTAASNRLRLPAVLASGRIGLSDARCAELGEQLQDAQHECLNLPAYTDIRDKRTLQERINRLEDRLHSERLALFKDLASLLTTSRDASVDAARSAFLKEFSRQTASPGDRR